MNHKFIDINPYELFEADADRIFHTFRINQSFASLSDLCGFALKIIYC